MPHVEKLFAKKNDRDVGGDVGVDDDNDRSRRHRRLKPGMVGKHRTRMEITYYSIYV